MIHFLQRIKLSSRHILRESFKWTTTLYAVAGFVSLFVSLEGIFKDTTAFKHKIVYSIIILAIIWVLCALILSLIVGLRKKKKVVEGLTGKSVYVVYGDLFDPKLVKNAKRYICFAVNRCFDTIVDDELIASTSVHGMAFNKLYNQGIYNQATLNNKIQRSLKFDKQPIILKKEDKPKGNLNRYEVGSYANLRIDETLHYLLIGLTQLDENLNAQTSKSEFVLAIQKMIESFDKEAQGHPVLLPIISTGRARTALKEREALEFIIETFRINLNKITSDVYIVIHESAKNRVSIAVL